MAVATLSRTPPEQRWLTPTLAVHGELTAGGDIFLIATGAEHEIVAAAKLLEPLTPKLKPSEPKGALVLPCTWAAVVQLAHTFGPAWQPGPRLRAWVLEEMARRVLPELPALTYQPPDGRVPRPYQTFGAVMLAQAGRGLLFDDPGTGKTITTILGLMERGQRADVFPAVVLAPASVVDPWVNAWREWAPSVRTVAWRGRFRKRLLGTADVYVTSYDTGRMDAPPGGKGALLDLRPKSVVLDECHLIKSRDAMRSLAARRLAKKAQVFVALSGTPITHHPGDLWPTLEGLAPGAFPSGERFDTRYLDMAAQDYGRSVRGLLAAREPEFRATIMGQHRRVAKADVLDELPPKIYSQRVVELPPDYRRAYDDLEEQMLATLPDGTELSVMSVLAQLTRLSQLASAAADVTVTYGPDRDPVTGEEKEHVNVTLKAPSWKVDALLEVLEERPDEQVVCFAPSRQLVTLAGAAAQRAGMAVGYVVGGQSMKERTETVEAFQAGKLRLLCVTTQAGGVGLTLTAARTVVFLQRPWSLVEALQAEDRCHRIGSERHETVEIIDIVAAATIDGRVRSVLHEKAGALASLLQDPRIVTELLGGSQRKAR